MVFKEYRLMANYYDGRGNILIRTLSNVSYEEALEQLGKLELILDGYGKGRAFIEERECTDWRVCYVGHKRVSEKDSI